MRIAVLGSGANGASIGADLTEAGLDVTLIEQWPAHVEAMRADGVQINLPTHMKQVPVRVLHLCDVATLTEKFDVVLMLMKAYDSRWAAQLIEPHLAADGLLVGLQNGMTVDVISEVVGLDRTLGCVIEISSMMFEPGVIERHSDRDRSWFAVGALSGPKKDQLSLLASLLKHSGEVEIVDDIRAAKWMKLVSNSSTLVPTAILGLPIVEVAGIPEMRSMMVDAGVEALLAMDNAGVAVCPIFGMEFSAPVGGRLAADQREGLVNAMLDWLLDRYVLPGTKTTVLQDWVKGRRSEVEDINGLVALTNRNHDTLSPVNEAIVAMARMIESHDLSPDPSNLGRLISEGRKRGWGPSHQVSERR